MVLGQSPGQVALGSAVKLGSSASARLIFTTPDRVFHRSMSLTKSAGSSVGGRCSRKAILGCRLVTTSGAVSSSPPSSTTPVTRPAWVLTRSTRALVRISAPKDSRRRPIAAATAPMPPSG